MGGTTCGAGFLSVHRPTCPGAYQHRGEAKRDETETSEAFFVLHRPTCPAVYQHYGYAIGMQNCAASFCGHIARLAL